MKFWYSLRLANEILRPDIPYSLRSITVAGNDVSGFADGVGAAARFNRPVGITVDGKGTIVVTDKVNHRLRKIVGGHVTTLAGSSEPGTADGAGAVTRFH